VTQAALPFLREQGSGHFLQVSSIGGITAFPGIGMYHASKWALEGISQALAQEVEGFGIHVTLIEPGGFATDWGGSSARHAEPHDAYAGVHEPPLRAFFGSRPLGIAEKHYERRLATWRQWQPVAEIAQGNGP